MFKRIGMFFVAAAVCMMSVAGVANAGALDNPVTKQASGKVGSSSIDVASVQVPGHKGKVCVVAIKDGGLFHPGMTATWVFDCKSNNFGHPVGGVSEPTGHVIINAIASLGGAAIAGNTKIVNQVSSVAIATNR